MAVGHKRAHPPSLCEGERLTVARFGLLSIRGITMSGNLAEKPQGIRFVTPFLLGLGDLERAPRAASPPRYSQL